MMRYKWFIDLLNLSSVSPYVTLIYQVESITEATNSLMSLIRSTLAIRPFKCPKELIIQNLKLLIIGSRVVSPAIVLTYLTVYSRDIL